MDTILRQRDYRYLKISPRGLKKFTHWITVQDPKNKGILAEIIMELKLYLQYIKSDKSIRVIVITSETSDSNYLFNFSLEDIVKNPNKKTKKLKRELRKFYFLLEDLNKITIAAVNGHVKGEGLEMISHFDFRFILDDLTLYLNKNISGKEAKELGIVTNHFSKTNFLENIQNYADVLSKRPPIAVDAIKKCVYYGMRTSLRTGLCIESQQSVRCMISEDAQFAMKKYIKYVKEKVNVPLNNRPFAKEVLNFNQQPSIYEKFQGK